MNASVNKSIDLKSHWNKVYRNTDEEKLGWYEEKPLPSIELIHKTGISKNDKILIVGAGTSNLIDWLIENGNTNICINDISEAAIDKLKSRIKPTRGKISWVIDDITASAQLIKLRDIRLWHDRAVLHFLTTRNERESYFKLINLIVEPGGYVIIAAFSKEGVHVCSGLPVVNYDVEMIAGELGHQFYLLDSFHYVHNTPSGDPRPYIYTLFRRHINTSE